MTWIHRLLLGTGAFSLLAAGSYVGLSHSAAIERQYQNAETQVAVTVHSVKQALTFSPRQPRQIQPIPILMYHYIRTADQAQDPLGYDLSVTPDQFRSHLEALAAAGYTTITPTQYLNGESDEHSIILSFDDGYRDFAEMAAPLLAEYGMTAVVFVISGTLDNPDGRYLTRTQVRTLADAGIEIGGHSVSHANLTGVAPRRLQDELLVSRFVLEEVAGRRVTALAYPSGHYNDTVIRMADFVGYQFAVTTEPGIAQPTDQRLALPRIRVRADMTADGLLDAVGYARSY